MKQTLPALLLLTTLFVNAQSPTLLWGTYFGGSGLETGLAITKDGRGNIYITGLTGSDTGIVTPGAFQTTRGGASDAFIAKFNSAGEIVWATYFGGPGYDVGTAIATDASDNVFITGTTYSATGIATTGAFDTADVANQYTGFLAKFDSSGSRLWATYYGGTGYEDGPNGVATDGAGNVYITGITYSSDGIASAGAYDVAYGGPGGDAFLAKFSSDGTRLWGTYFGGAKEDVAYAVATDGAANVYITGNTSSATNIATSGGLLDSLTGFSAGFLAKFDSAGGLHWATYYGEGQTQNTYGYGVATDNLGNVLITGSTNTDSGIATAGAYDTLRSGQFDSYIAKFDTTGALVWGTYYGGSLQDEATAITTDVSGNAYITGYTEATTGIATAGAYLSTGDTIFGNAYLAKFSSTGQIVYGTYYGGSSYDIGYGLVTDTAGNIYMVGGTTSTAGIATTGAYQSVFGGNGVPDEGESGDAFLAKFGVLEGIATIATANTITVYPNPSTGQFYFKGINSGSTLEVYDVLGQNIFTTIISPPGAGSGWTGDNYLLNISAQPKGVYFYRVVNSGVAVQAGKMVVD